MVNVGIFYDLSEYFMAVWYSLRSFVIFFPILVCLDQEKSGNPGAELTLKSIVLRSEDV
jgi:hypothetical protein